MPITEVLREKVRGGERVTRDEAVALLRAEIDGEPSEAASVQRAAYLLCESFLEHRGSDVEFLWVWLSRRPAWDYVESRVLRTLLPRDDRAEYGAPFVRAEGLVRGG